ncbi:hypothetical protein B0H13DRAFT_2373051 [Mycena leptocephala]|nr:hypothetical protein B0H13DRAFT_2373051 [Mycena leptocephala]
MHRCIPAAHQRRPSTGLPRMPSSGAAASSPCRPGHLQTGHPTVRVVPLCGISPPRRDLIANASSLAADRDAASLLCRTPRILRVGETTPRHHRLAAAERGAFPYLHALRRCTADASACLCQLQSGLSLVYARMLPLLPPRVRLLALSLSRHRISFSGAYLPLQVSSPGVFRRIRSVNLFFERLSWSPFTRFPRSPPGIIPRRH